MVGSAEVTRPEAWPIAAPAFSIGVTWLPGGPLKLAELHEEQRTLVDRMEKIESREDRT